MTSSRPAPRRPARRSAGLLVHRQAAGGGLEVLLAHMGGPFWARKDEGAWSIPKGELEPDEDPLATARREFAEELGSPAPDGDLVPLGEVRQSGGKVVEAWAVEADFDATGIRSNTVEIEWPPRSGRRQSFPEIDRAQWFGLDVARTKVVAGQRALLDRLAELAGQAGPGGQP